MGGQRTRGILAELFCAIYVQNKITQQQSATILFGNPFSISDSLCSIPVLNALICNHPLQKTIHPGEPGGGLRLDLDIVCTNLLFERLTKILTKTACGEAMLNGPFARTLNFILFFFLHRWCQKTQMYILQGSNDND